MNYLNIYNTIIARSQSFNRVKRKRNNSTEPYYERHHIKPKSLGGSNLPKNLCLLTAKEHFVSHHLLYKHYQKYGTTQEEKKMALAYKRMSTLRCNSDKHNKRVTAKMYDSLSKSISLGMTGKGNPMYGKENSRKGKKIILSEQAKQSYITKRNTKFTTPMKWVNSKTGDTAFLSVHDIAETYTLHKAHVYGVLSGDRSNVKGWHLEGTDCRNFYVKEFSSKEFIFINMSSLYSRKCTVEELLQYDTSLTYKGLKSMVRSNLAEACASYKGWALTYTFNVRKLSLWEHDFKWFTLRHRRTGETICGTVRQLASKLNRKQGKLMEYLKMKNRKTVGVGFSDGWDLC